MNQEVMYRFSVIINERLMQFTVAPNTPWLDAQEALEQFKLGLKAMEQQAIEVEEKKKSSVEASS